MKKNQSILKLNVVTGVVWGGIGLLYLFCAYKLFSTEEIPLLYVVLGVFFLALSAIFYLSNSVNITTGSWKKFSDLSHLISLLHIFPASILILLKLLGLVTGRISVENFKAALTVSAILAVLFFVNMGLGDLSRLKYKNKKISNSWYFPPTSFISGFFALVILGYCVNINIERLIYKAFGIGAFTTRTIVVFLFYAYALFGVMLLTIENPGILNEVKGYNFCDREIGDKSYYFKTCFLDDDDDDDDYYDDDDENK